MKKTLKAFLKEEKSLDFLRPETRNEYYYYLNADDIIQPDDETKTVDNNWAKTILGNGDHKPSGNSVYRRKMKI